MTVSATQNPAIQTLRSLLPPEDTTETSWIYRDTQAKVLEVLKQLQEKKEPLSNSDALELRYLLKVQSQPISRAVAQTFVALGDSFQPEGATMLLSSTLFGGITDRQQSSIQSIGLGEGIELLQRYLTEGKVPYSSDWKKIQAIRRAADTLKVDRCQVSDLLTKILLDAGLFPPIHLERHSGVLGARIGRGVERVSIDDFYHYASQTLPYIDGLEELHAVDLTAEYLQALTEPDVLPFCKNLKFFKDHCRNIVENHTDYLAAIVKNTPSLRRINLWVNTHLQGWSKSSADSIDGFLQQLKESQIEEIVISASTTLPEGYYRKLGEAFAAMPTLKTLDICNIYPKKQEANCRELIEGLQGAKQLECLKLDLSHDDASKAFYKTLSQTLPQLSKLKECTIVNVAFPGLFGPSAPVIQLAKTLSTCPSIETLHVKGKFTQTFLQYAKKNSSIKTLILEDVYWGEWPSFLDKFTALEEITVEFDSHPGHHVPGFHHLGLQLFGSVNLKRARIHMHTVPADFFEQMTRAIETCKGTGLREFALQIRNNPEGRVAPNSFFTTLRAHVIDSIVLDGDFLREQGVITLARSLKKLPDEKSKIQRLSLSHAQLGASGTAALVKAVKSWKHSELKELAIRYSLVAPDAMALLAEGGTRLQSLDLEGTLLGERTIKKLARGVKTAWYLQTLNLAKTSTSWSEKMDEEVDKAMDYNRDKEPSRGICGVQRLDRGYSVAFSRNKRSLRPLEGKSKYARVSSLF